MSLPVIAHGSWLLLRAVMVGALAVFLLLPTVFIFPLALSDADFLSFPPDGWSLRHIDAVLSSELWQSAFVSSFQVGLVAALLATALGTICALVLPGIGKGWKTPLELAIVSPFVIPPVVLAVAWFSLFSELNLIGSFWAVVIGHALLGLPIVYLNVSAGLSLLDQRVVMAARSLGASPAVAFLRVIMPLIAPSMAAGAFLTFVLSLDELIVALFIGSGSVDTLPVVMWSQINYVASPEIAAAAATTVVLSIGGLVLTAVCWQLMRRRRDQ